MFASNNKLHEVIKIFFLLHSKMKNGLFSINFHLMVEINGKCCKSEKKILFFVSLQKHLLSTLLIYRAQWRKFESETVCHRKQKNCVFCAKVLLYNIINQKLKSPTYRWQLPWCIQSNRSGFSFFNFSRRKKRDKQEHCFHDDHFSRFICPLSTQSCIDSHFWGPSSAQAKTIFKLFFFYSTIRCLCVLQISFSFSVWRFVSFFFSSMDPLVDMLGTKAFFVVVASKHCCLSNCHWYACMIFTRYVKEKMLQIALKKWLLLLCSFLWTLCVCVCLRAETMWIS